MSRSARYFSRLERQVQPEDTRPARERRLDVNRRYVEPPRRDAITLSDGYLDSLRGSFNLNRFPRDALVNIFATPMDFPGDGLFSVRYFDEEVSIDPDMNVSITIESDNEDMTSAAEAIQEDQTQDESDDTQEDSVVSFTAEDDEERELQAYISRLYRRLTKDPSKISITPFLDENGRLYTDRSRLNQIAMDETIEMAAPDAMDGPLKVTDEQIKFINEYRMTAMRGSSQIDRLAREAQNIEASYLRALSAIKEEWQRQSTQKSHDLTPDDLREMARFVRSVHFHSHERSFSVITTPITIDFLGPDGRMVKPFGSMLVIFSEVRCSAYQYSHQTKPNGSSDRIHPHVAGNGGKVCLGEVASAYHRAFISGDIPELVKLVYGILSTYNPESPYTPLHRFSDAPPKNKTPFMCFETNKPSKAPIACEHCGRRIDHCKCNHTIHISEEPAAAPSRDSKGRFAPSASL